MGVDAEVATSRGDVLRRLRGLEKEVERLHSDRRLESASIGAGGLRVRDGFIIILDASGSETMRLSTAGLTMEGILRVLGAIEVSGEGRITSTGQDAEGPGIVEVISGTIRMSRGLSGEQEGLIQAAQAADGTPRTFIAMTPPHFTGTFEDVAFVIEGRNTVAVDGAIFLSTKAQDTRLTLETSIFVVTDEQLFLITPDTTGNAANVHMSAGGRIFRVTSSARGKTDIQDADIDPERVLQLRSRTWVDANVTEDASPLRMPNDRKPSEARQQPQRRSASTRNIGFIAEEVDEAGLEEFVGYDAAGQPETIAYDRLTVALLSVVKRQSQQIKDLQARVSALEVAA